MIRLVCASSNCIYLFYFLYTKTIYLPNRLVNYEHHIDCMDAFGFRFVHCMSHILDNNADKCTANPNDRHPWQFLGDGFPAVIGTSFRLFNGEVTIRWCVLDCHDFYIVTTLLHAWKVKRKIFIVDLLLLFVALKNIKHSILPCFKQRQWHHAMHFRSIDVSQCTFDEFKTKYWYIVIISA